MCFNSIFLSIHFLEMKHCMFCGPIGVVSSEALSNYNVNPPCPESLEYFALVLPLKKCAVLGKNHLSSLNLSFLILLEKGVDV